MTEPRRIKRALISVYDKTGIVDFARALYDEFGIELISTGGTAKVLKDAGLPVTLVEDITGFPEMLDGRVKTLHPKIHAAILADRDNPEHMRQLAEQGIEPIDMVVVNLYPFEQTIAKPGCTLDEAIEMIDIGGPCLLRAAAKNHKHVLVLMDAEDRDNALSWMRGPEGGLTEQGWKKVRRDYAEMAFERTSRYDARIVEYLSRGGRRAIHASLQSLRYGENPHQTGWGGPLAETPAPIPVRGIPPSDWQPRPLPWAGFGLSVDCPVEVSFNNYMDASAALELCAELTRAGLRAPLSIAGSTSDRTPGPPRQAVWHRPMAGEPGEPVAKPRKPTKPQQPGSSRRRIDDETATRRNLPHIQRPGATYFITFRTHQGQFSPQERDLVMDCCLFADRRQHCLHAAVCMPNHVHLLLTPLEAGPRQWHALTEILHDLKGNIGRRVAESRGRPGAVLQDESFDHIIRNRDDFFETLEYIRTNPERAKLTADGAYPWLVVEEEPDWDAGTRAGVVDLKHRFMVHRLGDRAWHERLAPSHPETPVGGPASESPGRSASDHRPLAGATLTSGATPAIGATPAAEATPATVTVAAACFIKHTNACGTAVARPGDVTPQGLREARVAAYRRAYLGDPNAAMGGILAVNFPVDAAFAAVVMETYARFGKPLKDAGHPAAPGGFFVEVWLAPHFTPDAVAVIRGTYDPATAQPEPGEPRLEPTPDAPLPKKDWGQRVRLLAVGDLSVEPDPGEMDFKRIAGGVLMQTRDLVGLNEDQWQVVTERAPTEQEMNDLRLAWLICKHTKSNAITICRDGMLLGNGAGQMSRVMSCRIATWLARENGHEALLKGAVAASDAFFPFRDGPDLLIDAGVTALIQPGGSKRDADTIAACNERGVAMIFTGTRHFRH